mgnify:CR=1 FL=1
MLVACRAQPILTFQHRRLCWSLISDVLRMSLVRCRADVRHVDVVDVFLVHHCVLRHERLQMMERSNQVSSDLPQLRRGLLLKLHAIQLLFDHLGFWAVLLHHADILSVAASHSWLCVATKRTECGRLFNHICICLNFKLLFSVEE